ncbi:MAG: biotin--[acetyl-CoA-carboxylase] ligase [Actinomycetota bacterium]|nr:biotin--[acetyl-CoA-carboxylase] ligase [Actinomycetota bacterium]
MGETFDPQKFQFALRRVPWVRDVHAERVVSSTNDVALELAGGGAAEGTVVVADHQTAGRGRLGRGWWSQPGGSLIASWVLRPALPPDRWPFLTLVAGVALCDALLVVSGVKATLKWPNDVLIGEAKCAGILAEARPPGAVVIGLGVNVSGHVPADAAEGATSIVGAGAEAPRRSDLLAEVLRAFGAFMPNPASVLPRYRELSATLGTRVRAQRAGGGSLTGSATDVDEGGALLIDAGGEIVRVTAGEIIHLRTYD